MKKFSIVTHVYTTGPAQDLKEYLNKNKANEVIFVGHPLFYSKNVAGSGFEVYADGDLSTQYYTNNIRIPMLVSYVWTFFLTLLYGVRFMWQTDLYIGCNNLNALAGLILRKFGVVKRVVYYVIDYNPKRFSNKLVNSIYHKIDQICVTYCDETWNLSPRMAEGREKYFGYKGGHQKTVPIGIWYDRLPRKSFDEIEKHTAVFHGHLLEKQGVQHLIAAIPLIRTEIPDFRLVVLGDGPYKSHLIELARKLSVEEYVVFKGYFEKHTDLEAELCKYALAVALYNKFEANGDLTFTYFADPGKLKLYLGCGLPVLITDVSYNAKELEENNCGRIIVADTPVISKTIIDMLISSDTLVSMRSSAINYAKRFDWEYIFKEIFK